MAEKAVAQGIPAEALAGISSPTFDNLNSLAMEGADAIIVGSEALTDGTQAALVNLDKPILSYRGKEGFTGEINTFYDAILEGKTEAVAE
jgi:hypothetical protein